MNMMLDKRLSIGPSTFCDTDETAVAAVQTSDSEVEIRLYSPDAQPEHVDKRAEATLLKVLAAAKGNIDVSALCTTPGPRQTLDPELEIAPPCGTI
jgi:hypothetical protein